MCTGETFKRNVVVGRGGGELEFTGLALSLFLLSVV